MTEIVWVSIKLSELYKFISNKKVERIYLVNKIVRRRIKEAKKKDG